MSTFRPSLPPIRVKRQVPVLSHQALSNRTLRTDAFAAPRSDRVLNHALRSLPSGPLHLDLLLPRRGPQWLPMRSAEDSSKFASTVANGRGLARPHPPIQSESSSYRP